MGNNTSLSLALTLITYAGVHTRTSSLLAYAPHAQIRDFRENRELSIPAAGSLLSR